jgi:serine/threonine-protein kinase
MSFDPEGQVLEGKYRLMRQLGEGGMGVVWAAEHVRLGRALAVKLLRADLAENPRTLQRFHQEAVAASRIGNPHIVEVIDLGTAPNNAPFIVMELLEGQTLYDLLQDQPVLPIGRAVDIVCQVLSGLAAAHAKNIVHRDLKPANVFLTRYGSREDFVKIVDFGVSKILDSDAQLTRSGALLGTPTYMAPEQIMARQRLDHRVDLWAAGVILYMALTGRRPHEAPTRNELLVRIVNSDVKPLRPLRREVDEQLEQIVLRALQRDKARRWSTAQEFRDALLPYRVQQGLAPGAGRSTLAGGSVPPGRGSAGPLPTPSAPPAVEDQTVSTPGLVPVLGPSFSAPSALPPEPVARPAAPSVRPSASAARPAADASPSAASPARTSAAVARPGAAHGPVAGARDSAASPSQLPTTPRLARGPLPAEPAAIAPPEVDSERVSVVWEISPAGRKVAGPTSTGTTVETSTGGWRWILAAIVIGLGLIVAVTIVVVLGRGGGDASAPPADASGEVDTR